MKIEEGRTNHGPSQTNERLRTSSQLMSGSGSQAATRDQPAGGEDMDSVAFGQAELPQTGSDDDSEPLELDEADIPISTHLEVGPVFIDLALFAVDELLHLLRLGMGLEQTSGSHGLGVAIFLRAMLQEVVKGSNTGR